MPAHGAVLQRNDGVRQPGVDQRLRADDRARASSAVHHHQRLRALHDLVDTIDEFRARAVERTGDVHHPVLAHRSRIEHHDVLACIEACLQFGGSDSRRAAGMLDVLAKGLARHVDSGEEFKTRGAPRAHTAAQHRDMAIAETAQRRRRALRECLVAVAQHDARSPPRHHRFQPQLQARQRDAGGGEQVAGGEHAFFAHVQERDLAAVAEHFTQFARGDQRAENLGLRHEAPVRGPFGALESDAAGQVLQRAPVEVQMQPGTLAHRLDGVEVFGHERNRVAALHRVFVRLLQGPDAVDRAVVAAPVEDVVLLAAHARDHRPGGVVVRRLAAPGDGGRTVHRERAVRVFGEVVDRARAPGADGEVLLRKELAPRSERDERRLDRLQGLARDAQARDDRPRLGDRARGLRCAFVHHRHGVLPVHAPRVSGRVYAAQFPNKGFGRSP